MTRDDQTQSVNGIMSWASYVLRQAKRFKGVDEPCSVGIDGDINMEIEVPHDDQLARLYGHLFGQGKPFIKEHLAPGFNIRYCHC